MESASLLCTSDSLQCTSGTEKAMRSLVEGSKSTAQSLSDWCSKFGETRTPPKSTNFHHTLSMTSDEQSANPTEVEQGLHQVTAGINGDFLSISCVEDHSFFWGKTDGIIVSHLLTAFGHAVRARVAVRGGTHTYPCNNRDVFQLSSVADPDPADAHAGVGVALRHSHGR